MLVVATINVQNKYKIKKYDGKMEKEDHIKMLCGLISKYSIDIVGLQEVNQWYQKRLRMALPENYTYYGKFRFFHNFITEYFYPFSTFNESVPIVTNKKVLRTKTKVLPWVSSYVPRIATIMELETEELGPITVINTHLDFLKKKTKIKQIHTLFEIIKQIRKPIILMGDFNLTIRTKEFRNFVLELENLGIMHVQVEEKTLKSSKKNDPIDHIFLSKCFQVEEIYVEKEEKYRDFSDHYPVIVKLSLGFPEK